MLDQCRYKLRDQAGISGSLRGRLGYAIDRFMIYGDAGVAFTKYKFAETDFPQSFGGGQGLAGRQGSALNMLSPTIGPLALNGTITISARRTAQAA
jgi:opacity protein-like surface antigen